MLVSAVSLLGQHRKLKGEKVLLSVAVAGLMECAEVGVQRLDGAWLEVAVEGEAVFADVGVWMCE